MVKANDARYPAWLQVFFQALARRSRSSLRLARRGLPAKLAGSRSRSVICGSVIVAALLLTACSGAGSPAAPPDLTRHWPPDNPRQPQRLATPLPAGADPLVWWKATFFDTLPAAVYPDSLSTKVAESLIEETNKTRADNGLGAVSEDPLLDRVAEAHAIDEATRDYWNHKNPEGMGSHLRVLAASGITVTAGGENSAVSDTLDYGTGGSVVNTFLYHPGHRELLLSTAVQRIGVGIYRYAPGEQVHIIQLLMAY